MPFNYKSIAKTGSVSTQIKWVYFHSVEFWGGFVCEFHYGLYMVDMSSDIEKTDSYETIYCILMMVFVMLIHKSY